MIRTLFVLLGVLILWGVPALADDTAPATELVYFNLADHLAILADEPCSVCHREDDATITPNPGACLECHDQDFIDTVSYPAMQTHGPLWGYNHKTQAKNPTYDCAACHQQSFCLDCHQAGFADEMGDFGNNLVNVHRSDFHVTHPITARTNPQLCATCHEKKFCSDCHNDFAPADLALLSHRKGWSTLSVGAAPHASFSESMCQTCHINSVLPSHQWTSSHAREARKNLATCQACHPEGDVCLTCHSAVSGLGVSPHPKDWDKFKNRLDGASNGRTCRKCH